MEAPLYQPLNPDDVRKIDHTGRRILEEVGIHISSSDFRDRLENAGVNVDRDTNRVRFSQSWLDEYIAKAPSQFTLYSRDGKNDLRMGSGDIHFGNGGRVFRILDMRTGGYRYYQ